MKDLESGRRWRTWLLAIVVLVGGAWSASAWAAPATHTIIIEGTRFTPETLVVHRGDRVVWANKDPFPHTATASTGAFDSKSIGANRSWTYVANKSGTFDYGCTFHVTMKGRLIVE